MTRRISFCLGNPLSMELLFDRDDGRSVNCFPSEIYVGRSANNPYTNLKHRSKQSTRISRFDTHEHKKLQINDDEKSFAFSNLRRKSLSSCDLFHVTSKTLTSPFDEIHNWLNNKSEFFILIFVFEENFSRLQTQLLRHKTRWAVTNSN